MSSEATQVRKCVLHEGSIAHLELNLASPVYQWFLPVLAAFLPAENNCLHLTESFCVCTRREEDRRTAYIRLRRWTNNWPSAYNTDIMTEPS